MTRFRIGDTPYLIEYCPDIRVIINDNDNHLIKVSIRDLLPFAWKPVIVE